MHTTADARFALVCLLAVAISVALARKFESDYVVEGARRGVAVELRDAGPMEQGDAVRDGRRLDVNRATAVELELLPGVGPRLAREIVDSRAQRGPFGTLSDLRRVRGIGGKTLARLAPFLRFPSEQFDEPAHSE